MPIKEHDPLSDEPTLLSPEKRAFCANSWGKPGAFKQAKVMVFHHAMNTTPRPTAPDESIGYGYMNNNKFHDREPKAIQEAIEKVDPTWFDDYPRKASTALDDDFKRGVISELARTFYRYGLAAYGKPGLRKQDDPPQPGAAPLGGI